MEFGIAFRVMKLAKISKMNSLRKESINIVNKHQKLSKIF